MKAAWYERQGPRSEVLVIGETTTPEPEPGEVRIRVLQECLQRLPWSSYSSLSVR